jgi:hypothetical protein
MYKNDLQKYHITIYNILKFEQLKDKGNNEKRFYLFITEDEFNLFEKLYNVFSAEDNFDDQIKNLKDIINIFKKSNSIISFKKLYELDRNWYEYYNTSADIEGNLTKKETRYGVNKNYVKDIMIIKKKYNLDLDNSIIFHQKIKNRLIIPFEDTLAYQYTNLYYIDI